MRLRGVRRICRFVYFWAGASVSPGVGVGRRGALVGLCKMEHDALGEFHT